MHVNTIWELSKTLDSDKFGEVMGTLTYMESDEDGCYTDSSMSSEGLTFRFRDSRYKKKIQVLANTELLMDGDYDSPKKISKKIGKYIKEYFDESYSLNDFMLTGFYAVHDIDVNNTDRVSSYIDVFRRIGMVKGFSTADRYECFNKHNSFCLKGNSNGIRFQIYDLHDLAKYGLMDSNCGGLKTKAGMFKGIMRVEVRLEKMKAIREYTSGNNTAEQIAELSHKADEVFMDVFTQVIPFGDFCKKNEAINIICRRIDNMRMRRRMTRLVALVPEKKSLLLAQKAIEYRHMDKLMEEFAKINLSPVTISKRQDEKHLKNIYEYLAK